MDGETKPADAGKTSKRPPLRHVLGGVGVLASVGVLALIGWLGWTWGPISIAGAALLCGWAFFAIKHRRENGPPAGGGIFRRMLRWLLSGLRRGDVAGGTFAGLPVSGRATAGRTGGGLLSHLPWIGDRTAKTGTGTGTGTGKKPGGWPALRSVLGRSGTGSTKPTGAGVATGSGRPAGGGGAGRWRWPWTGKTGARATGSSTAASGPATAGGATGRLRRLLSGRSAGPSPTAGASHAKPGAVAKTGARRRLRDAASAAAALPVSAAALGWQGFKNGVTGKPARHQPPTKQTPGRVTTMGASTNPTGGKTAKPSGEFAAGRSTGKPATPPAATAKRPPSRPNSSFAPPTASYGRRPAPAASSGAGVAAPNPGATEDAGVVAWVAGLRGIEEGPVQMAELYRRMAAQAEAQPHMAGTAEKLYNMAALFQSAADVGGEVFPEAYSASADYRDRAEQPYGGSHHIEEKGDVTRTRADGAA